MNVLQGLLRFISSTMSKPGISRFGILRQVQGYTLKSMNTISVNFKRADTETEISSTVTSVYDKAVRPSFKDKSKAAQ